MRNFRLLAVLMLVSAVLLFGRTGVATAEPPSPGNPNPAVVGDLIQQLADAGPEADQVWAGLPPEAQQAVQEALEVTRVTRSIEFGPRRVVSPPSDQGVVIQTTYCRWARVKVLYENALGGDLFAYFQKIDWCYNGSWITSVFRTRWGEVYYPFWEFRGHIGNYTSGGVGYWSYRAWTQGSFAFCIPYLGCSQYKYPWIDMTVRANGTWTYSYGG